MNILELLDMAAKQHVVNVALGVSYMLIHTDFLEWLRKLQS